MATNTASSDPRLVKARRAGFGLGLIKGLGVTLKHLFKHNSVIQYPDVKQDLSPRTRGVIALKEENCTVCMLCGRECPDWCIYIESHKETLPPKREGGRPRKRNVLDRFAIDYALCMYCGICVEVCPYDALFWSREFEYAEYDIRELTHEKERLADWMATVLPPPPLEHGAEIPGQAVAAPVAASEPAVTVSAEGARPPTTTASAVEARPEQAETAPTSGTFATTADRPAASVAPSEAGAPVEAPPEEPAAMRAETREQGVPGETRAEAAPAAESETAVTPQEASRKAPAGNGAATQKSGPAETASPAAGAAKEPSGKAAPKTTPPADAEAAPNVKVPHEQPRPEPLDPAEDPEAVYRQVLQEQLDKGSSPQVAEARAKVARVKAERGIRRTGAAPALTPPTPSGAPRAAEPEPKQGPVAPTEDEPQ